MANTWIATSVLTAVNTDETLFGLVNGGANTLKVRRVSVHHGGTVSVSAGITTFYLYRYTATVTWVADVAITPYPMDSGNSALDTVSAGTGGNPTTTGSMQLFRAWLYYTLYPQLSGTGWPEWECLIPLSYIWDAGYQDTNLEPMYLEYDMGLFITRDTSRTNSIYIDVEFTDE
jgi:hypothetical protein